MSYTIYKSDGTAVVVPDNAIDVAFYNPVGGSTGAGLGTQLVGRNAINYGAPVAQNFLQMTENFSSNVVPSDATALQGQLWFNKTSNTSGSLYVRVTGNNSGGILNWEQVVTSGSGNAPTASKLLNARTIAATGDATWSVSFDGSANVSGALTLSNSGATAGTYGTSTTVPVITVDAKGRITSVTSLAITTPPSSGLAGGVAGNLPYQSAPSVTSFLGTGSSNQVLVSGTTPAWTNTPTLTGTNFSGIPNGALVNSAITVGSTTMSLGSGSTSLAGLLSVTSTTFVGTLSGNASTATLASATANISGGVAGGIVYQSGVSTTGITAAGSAGQVLTSNGAGAPTWESGPASIGYSQTWQSFSIPAQRSSGTVYTNTTGRPIMMTVVVDNNSGTNIVIGGVNVLSYPAANITVSGSFIIPPGNTYSVTAPTNIGSWAELR